MQLGGGTGKTGSSETSSLLTTHSHNKAVAGIQPARIHRHYSDVPTDNPPPGLSFDELNMFLCHSVISEIFQPQPQALF